MKVHMQVVGKDDNGNRLYIKRTVCGQLNWEGAFYGSGPDPKVITIQTTKVTCAVCRKAL